MEGQQVDGKAESIRRLNHDRNQGCPPHIRALAELTLDLLSGQRSKNTGVEYDFEAFENGWIPCCQICEAVQEEMPGFHMTLGRLIS